MVQKCSNIFFSDNCGFYIGNVFHVYGGFKKLIGKPGDFIKVSIKSTTSDFIKFKGHKQLTIFLRSKNINKKFDGSFFFFKTNSSISLKKRLTPRGKEISGPACLNLRRKKFVYSFAGFI